MSQSMEKPNGNDTSTKVTETETKDPTGTGTSASDYFLEFYQCETGPDGSTSEMPKALFIQQMGATTDPRTVTLGEIRAMVKDQKAMKNAQNAPFCTKIGSEVNDTVKLSDYFTMSNSTNQSEGNSIPYPVYLKTIKVTSTVDQNFQDSLKTNFNQDLNMNMTV
ncbi:hypothetical protein TSTA_083460 [Talaromyces stipitatus ATCC 10500]|uniref:Uncharacterized protein n=1 Tax=Talaromyces stipitatus (strain ATCC 10500 / CBS 375.48 / QM 6759 / NRRL 1006) TaxID=441959 RepID=B8LZ70_TALSN|nr:uncharacterized protein TSTA_083460 [Talaromyces stipitatus ATCC 10500]EED21114.1 hypothetical protein TSTA_083460 [Talaromyces stipitatus ATCC 10500]